MTRDNPQAFPSQTEKRVNTPYGQNVPVVAYRDGMTLRDYFAAAVVTGLEGNPSRNTWAVEKIVQRAYKTADAMLVERVKL